MVDLGEGQAAEGGQEEKGIRREVVRLVARARPWSANVPERNWIREVVHLAGHSNLETRFRSSPGPLADLLACPQLVAKFE